MLLSNTVKYGISRAKYRFAMRNLPSAIRGDLQSPAKNCVTDPIFRISNSEFFKRNDIMSVESVKEYLSQFGVDGRVLEFESSSATVELAAAVLGVEGARIAKTLSFKTADGALLVVAAGDAKIDNRKFKDFFGFKAKMLSHEEAATMIGHAVGGVCPFAVNEGVEVYLDESIKRFETVFPAAGSSNSAIELTIAEMEQYSGFTAWVDVCKAWQ